MFWGQVPVDPVRQKWLLVESPRALLSHGVNLAHGVVEGQAEDLNAEVNGVASEVALRPPPIAVFDDEVGIGGQNETVRILRDDVESALLEQRHHGCQAGAREGGAGS